VCLLGARSPKSSGSVRVGSRPWPRSHDLPSEQRLLDCTPWLCALRPTCGDPGRPDRLRDNPNDVHRSIFNSALEEAGSEQLPDDLEQADSHWPRGHNRDARCPTYGWIASK